MKTSLTVLTLSLLIGAASVASAADDSAKAKDAKTDRAASAKVEKQKAAAKTDSKEELSTGSHMNQRVRRNGMITDGSSQVLVLDRSNIEHSGANTVSQVLNRYGAR
jgi:hypothetical protein